MIKGDQFVITFPEIVPGPLGTVLEDTARGDNYYADNLSRGTMCCNCAKETKGA
jgi:hypothetical protein